MGDDKYSMKYGNIFCMMGLRRIIKHGYGMVNWHTCICESNAFQDYFDEAKDSSQESRVKKVSRMKKSFNQSKCQESRVKQVSRIKIKIQDSSKESRLKIQESREDSIEISSKRVFQKLLNSTILFKRKILPRVLLFGNCLPEGSNRLPVANILFKLIYKAVIDTMSM